MVCGRVEICSSLLQAVVYIYLESRGLTLAFVSDDILGLLKEKKKNYGR